MVGERRRVLKAACQASLSENTGQIRLFKWRMYKAEFRLLQQYQQGFAFLINGKGKREKI